jgi:hypothetical protein
MILVAVLACGFAAAGLTASFRAVIQDHKPEWLLVKPFSCDLCMSFWSSIVFVATLVATESVSLSLAPLAVFGSVGVSLLSVKAANRLSS